MLLGIGAMPQNKDAAEEPPTAENGGDMRADEVPAAIKAGEENNAETERQQEEEPPMEPLESADSDERIEDEDEDEDLTIEDERFDEEEDLTNEDEKFEDEEVDEDERMDE